MLTFDKRKLDILTFFFSIHVCPGDKELLLRYCVVMSNTTVLKVLKLIELFVKDTGRIVAVTISMEMEMAQ